MKKLLSFKYKRIADKLLFEPLNIEARTIAGIMRRKNLTIEQLRHFSKDYDLELISCEAELPDDLRPFYKGSSV